MNDDRRLSDFGIEERSGVSQYKTTCPNCSATRRKSKEPCLSVDAVQGVWNCHNPGCGFKGGLKDSRPKYVRPQERPFTRSDRVNQWFKGRGISAETVEAFGVTCTDMQIVFPYLRNGRPINYKYRNFRAADGNRGFRQEKDAEKIFFNLDSLTRSDVKQCIITEGEVDAMTCVEVGWKHGVLSVPDGAPPPDSTLSQKKLSYIDNCVRELDAMNRVILALDNDPPGQYLAKEMARRYGHDRCWTISYPDGCKDLNEVLSKYGRDETYAMLLQPSRWPIEGLRTANAVVESILELYDRGDQRGVITGELDELDRLWSMRPGEVTVVTGVPSHGKSSLIDFIMYAVHMNYGWQFAVFSAENLPAARHFSKFISLWTGKPFSDRGTDRVTVNDIYVTANRISAAIHIIEPPMSKMSVETILELGKSAVRRHGIQGLVVDPWNRIDHQRPNGMNETDYIAHAITQMTMFAQAHDVHVIIVAHPTKMHKIKNKYPVPTLYDVSGSAHWRNMPDNGIVVWRNMDKVDNSVDVHVQKIRFDEVGAVGKAKLTYLPHSRRFIDRVEPMKGF